MPSFPCSNPTCDQYVPVKNTYCENHGGGAVKVSRHSFYDQHLRDPVAKAFYNSAAWLRARATKLANHPVCERCNHAWSEHVHHRIPLSQCTPEQKLDQQILMAVCESCHSIIEAEVRRESRR
jgi:5-methylcytosine-specific restriction protein A